jgi:hypothetical protein
MASCHIHVCPFTENLYTPIRNKREYTLKRVCFAGNQGAGMYKVLKKTSVFLNAFWTQQRMDLRKKMAYLAILAGSLEVPIIF